MRKSLEHPEAEVGKFGEGLRREREMRDISLDEIAAVTKIGTRLLRALEDEQFDQLPGGIFNKGYVRAYAKYVGIDEDQAVADYLQAAHEAAADMHGDTEQNTAGRFEKADRDQLRFPRHSTFPVVPVLIALVLIAGIAGGWRLYRERQLDRQQRTATTAAPDTTLHGPALSPPATGASTPGESSLPQTGSATTAHGDRDVIGGAELADTRTGTPGAKSAALGHLTGQTATSQPVSGQDTTKPQSATAPTSLATRTNNVANSAAATPFELTVRPKDRAWVSIKSDGKFVVRGIIKPPEVKTIRATDQVVFWTGNAGAVEVSFNGKNVPLTGGENEERVLVFTSHGLLPSSASQ